MIKSKLNTKFNQMQIFDQIFKKGNRTILSLTLLMIIAIIAMNYHNYKKSMNETNIKNLVNNIYFSGCHTTHVCLFNAGPDRSSN